MDIEFAKERSLELMRRSENAIVSSVDSQGYPEMKAMTNLNFDGLKSVYFLTYTSSRRFNQYLSNPKSSVYYMDPKTYEGFLLIGEMSLTQDSALRKKLWIEGNEIYYPLGVDDPTYSILHFTPQYANYYSMDGNIQFEL